jgi:hypothetical protein
LVVYDAPAKLAYEGSDKSTYADFKVKYEADAIAEVIAKKNSNTVAEVTTSEAPADLSVAPAMRRSLRRGQR